MKNLIIFPIISTLLLSVCMIGCDPAPSLSDVNDTNIEKVHALYSVFMSRHNMQGPKNKEELLEFFRTDQVGSIYLERSDIEKDDLEDLFISQRDGQPFVIRYGLRGEKDFPIVFEAEGVDGMRMVALLPPKEVDAETYEGHMDGSIAPLGPNDVPNAPDESMPLAE